MELQRVTQHTKPAVRRASWHVIDADGERLGHLASKIVNVLQGKHKADYSKHQIAGDFVIVVNAGKVDVSGNKRAQKIYYRHTGYVGHLRSRNLDEMLEKFPERVIEQAVKGMLPHNRQGRQLFRRLKVYARGDHPHEAQVNAGTAVAKASPAGAPTRRRRRAAAAEEPPVEEQAVASEAAANEAEATNAGAAESAVEAPPDEPETAEDGDAADKATEASAEVSGQAGEDKENA